MKHNNTPLISLSQLVLATHNPNKLAELQTYLQASAVDVIAPDKNLPDVEETGSTFEANALLKARAVAQATGLPALADDSGLCVWALDGRPGIYSARWVGPGEDYSHAFQRIENELQELGDAADRSASFVCVLALCFPDERPPRIFEGRVDGTLVTPARGPMRFGYDPVFVPKGYTQTFAEMPTAEKQAISHRTRALEKFVAAISK